MDVLTWTPSVLRLTPAHWTALADSLPGELLRLSPAPGEWSALECLQHLADIEPVFISRVRAFLAGQDFPAFDPDRQGTRPQPGQPASALAEDFARRRAEGLQVVAGVRAADLTRTVRHQGLGPVTLEHMLHEWAGHDLMHTVQAERALMQPFIRGCGPWRPYFAEHATRGA